jgi:hypothetical protein
MNRFTVSDLLALLLQTQAETLMRLGALFGEDTLLDMLENSDEPREDSPERAKPLLSQWTEPSAIRGVPDSGAAYARISNAVSGRGIPEFFEFHVFAWPYYRVWVEGEIDFNRVIRVDAAPVIAEAALAASRAFVDRLPMPDEYRPRARAAAEVPWVKFAGDVKARAGARRLSAV